ncbi:MAG: aldehyde dehydrogenase family protein [Propionibacteriales bacterium]|nr:aldehyde dehydrogenase family protein [Propionibacteriales bacterium]
MTILDSKTWSGRLFSAGWQSGSGGVSPVVEPATQNELEQVGLAGVEDVRSACAAASEAQPEWAARSYHERAAVLRRAGDLWTQHAADVHEWLIRESGSVPPKATLETDIAAQECYEAAVAASLPYGRLLHSNEPRMSMAVRVPAGVVGVISPFNAPLILAIRSVAPALALGNAVVLKPDPRTAVCGGVSLARVFEEAGLPPGLLHVLPGGSDVGEALVCDEAVSVVSFTGSTAAGRTVGELAGRHLKRVHLELGGNSALVILDDADVEAAAGLGAWGSWLHQGQICMTTGRHLVHESIAGEYVERLGKKADALPVGDPATSPVALGPIIDERQRDKIHGLVTASVDGGARLVAGGEYDGLFYRPTVLGDVPPETPAYAEEVFGPVAPVRAFSSLDEVVRMAADSPYGLSLGIVTRDVMHGWEVAQRIPTGIVHINDQTVSDEATIPFGGVRSSGTGARFGGAEANIEAFTDTRWVTMRGAPPAYPF